MLKNKVTAAKKMLFLGGAIWEGQDIRGVQKTPDILRQAKLLPTLEKKYGVECIDLGNVSAFDYEPAEEVNKEQADYFLRNLPLLDNLLQKVNERIVEGVKKHPDSLMVTVGGDHSVGTATLHAINSVYTDLKIIWVDAHPDFIHPKMSEYPNYHGYPVAHATGLASDIPGFKWLTKFVPYENIAYIAIRDIDPDEWINLKAKNMKCFTMDHVHQLGIGQVINQAIHHLDPHGDKPFYISFDIDGIHPDIAFGTGTKFRDGLSAPQANLIVRSVAHQRRLVGLDVMEINENLEKEDQRPIYRDEHYYGPVPPTVGLGIDLIQSLFTQFFTL